MCRYCVKGPTRTIFLPQPYEPLRIEPIPISEGYSYADMVKWYEDTVAKFGRQKRIAEVIGRVRE